MDVLTTLIRDAIPKFSASSLVKTCRGADKKTEEMTINVEGLILLVLSRVDPQAGIKTRLELAEKRLSEAEGYLSKGDVVRSSEKTFKVAEKLVKALAEKFDLPEHQQATKGITCSLTNAAAGLSRTASGTLRLTSTC